MGAEDAGRQARGLGIEAARVRPVLPASHHLDAGVPRRRLCLQKYISICPMHARVWTPIFDVQFSHVSVMVSLDALILLGL